MKSFLLILVGTFTLLSCGTEIQYFRKSLSNADKIYLSDSDSLIKKFSGKANWYRQYWTGDLLVKKIKNDLEIRQVGEWRQTSKDGKELYTIANFDKFGYIVDERILGDEGMPPIGETFCTKDTVNGQIRMVCEVTNRYHNGQLKEKGQRIIVNHKATKEGKWEYYTETGTLDKAVNYINDKTVQ
jgi:hypothetical protein